MKKKIKAIKDKILETKTKLKAISLLLSKIFISKIYNLIYKLINKIINIGDNNE
jgi:hypothetical protein